MYNETGPGMLEKTKVDCSYQLSMTKSISLSDADKFQSWWWISFGWHNSLVPSGTTSLPEPMMIQFMDSNELESSGTAAFSLHWCHNECDGISNHWRNDCLPYRLFRPRSKKTSKLHVSGLRGIHHRPVNLPHKVSVRQKMFLFDDVIMIT